MLALNQGVQGDSTDPDAKEEERQSGETEEEHAERMRNLRDQEFGARARRTTGDHASGAEGEIV